MKDIIKLNTHDGSNNYLEKLPNTINEYTLKTSIEFIRCGEVAENKKFVDPNGGPMLVEGEQLPAIDIKAKIIKISSITGQGFIITLEK